MPSYTAQAFNQTEKKSDRWYFAILCILCFVVPLPYAFASVSIILLAISWIFTGIQANFKQLAQNRLLWGWILFFIYHAISYFYSNDKGESLFDLESKLSFIVLPLIVGTGPAIKTKNIRHILCSFVAGVTFTGIIAFLYAGYAFLYLGGAYDNFFYNNLVRVTETNAVFMAWYTITALFILIIFSHSYFRMNKWLYGLVLIFLQIFFLALAARFLIAIEAVLILPVASFAYKKHKEYASLIVVSLGVAALIIIAITSNPITKRYKSIAPSQTKDWLLDKNDDSTHQEFTNVTLRLFLWKTALESISENKYYYFGCGNGDIRQNQKISIARYDKNLNPGNRKANLWQYNIHNMYIESLYMLGIPGLLLLLWIVLYPFKIINTPPYKLFSRTFIIVSALFMCIEAALQTQAGIIFYTLFSVLLIKISYNNKNQELS